MSCDVEKFAQTCLLVWAADILCISAFHASTACMLLHDCRIRVASLATPGSSRAARCISFFAFPTRPTLVCTSRLLVASCCLYSCLRQNPAKVIRLGFRCWLRLLLCWCLLCWRLLCWCLLCWCLLCWCECLLWWCLRWSWCLL